MTKISYVVEEQTDREYKDTILLDMYNDRAEMFANTYKEGDVVSVTFGGRVRDYTNREGVTKKICSLTALRVDLEGSSQQGSNTATRFDTAFDTAESSKYKRSSQDTKATTKTDHEEDLPF
jgi:single-stranded DNA-binding protein